MKYILLAALLSIATACSVVGPGQRGVRLILGKASDTVQQPGPHFWFPFIFGMEKITVRIQRSDIETSAGSRDMQEVKTHVAVNWSIAPNTVVKMYREIGDEESVLERIIVPATSEVIKAATSKKAAEEVLTKRSELKAEIDEALKQRLAGYGVALNDVNIVDIQFSADFTQAIENKQVAEQKAKQAVYEAEQAIQTAKAEVNRATGQAEAQRVLRANLTPEILQKMAIEKWSGNFPMVVAPNAMPLIDLGLKK